MIAPPPHLIERLKARYAEPERAYHTWAHIEALLTHFYDNPALLRDPTAVLWAIYWHDAVYDPRAGNNEHESARLLCSEARSILDDTQIAHAEAFILATIKHELPSGFDADTAADCGVFLDFDLSILAAPEDAFDAYEAQIRREYAFVPEDAYRAARASILKRFLERPRLYFTPELAKRWEQPARANVARSIARLTK